MSFTEELKSWTYGKQVDVKDVPQVGSTAPSDSKLTLPKPDGKPTIITFLRHCGCPFAERDFISFRAEATLHPEIAWVAVSHSSEAHTIKWLHEVGGAGEVEMVVDDSRQLHANWGLGPSGWMHVLSPSGFYSLYRLGKDEGIWNRPTETGSRWQTGGSFAVDGKGKVAFVQKPEYADELPRWEEAMKAVKT